MDKKTIAPGASVLYAPKLKRQAIAVQNWYGLLQFIWRLTGPRLRRC